MPACAAFASHYPRIFTSSYCPNKISKAEAAIERMKRRMMNNAKSVLVRSFITFTPGSRGPLN